jgi:hypothetical protein
LVYQVCESSFSLFQTFLNKGSYCAMYLRWCIRCSSRSEWPCGLRHELSVLAWMLWWWVEIPLKAWMSVLFILCRWCPCDGLIPNRRSRM